MSDAARRSLAHARRRKGWSRWWIALDVVRGSLWHRRLGSLILLGLVAVSAIVTLTVQVLLPWAVYAAL